MSFKNPMLNLGILIISVTVSFLTAELALRSVGYHGETFFRIQNTIIVDDPVLNWRFNPKSVFYFNDIVYRINERGFREYLYPYRKKDNIFRVFLASDSIGFGTNVQMKDSYPKILEAKLNALHMPYYFEVINYSMPGLSIKQKFHLVKLYAEKFNPNLIIIDYAVNDIAFESKKDFEREKNRKCSVALINLRVPCVLEEYLKKSAFIFFLKQGVENILHKMNWEDQNHFYKQVEGDYYQRLYSMDQKIEYLKTIFSQIGEYQKEKDIRIIVPIFPLIYDYNKYKWKDINELIITLCQENDLLYSSLLDEYKKFNYNELRVQRGDFGHPSVKGNTVAAESILKTIVKRDLLVLETSKETKEKINSVISGYSRRSNEN